MTTRKEVSFHATPTDHALIHQIAERASAHGTRDILCVIMDITATHGNGCPLDLKKLLHADSPNFYHDITGIIACLNRSTGKLKDNFLPRCARKETKP